jgi:hypothetical protein
MMATFFKELMLHINAVSMHVCMYVYTVLKSGQSPAFASLRASSSRFVASLSPSLPQLLMLALIALQSELFFILSVLLSGPHRREAQETLVNMGLVRILSQLMGYFDWGV